MSIRRSLVVAAVLTAMCSVSAMAGQEQAGAKGKTAAAKTVTTASGLKYTDVKVGSGASLAPGQGFGAGLGSLTLTSNLTLSGNAVFRQIGSQSDQVVCSGTVHYGGTLTLSNLSSAFQVGDSFTLFPAAGGYAGPLGHDQHAPEVQDRIRRRRGPNRSWAASTSPGARCRITAPSPPSSRMATFRRTSIRTAAPTCRRWRASPENR